MVRDPEASAAFYVMHLLPHAHAEWLGDSLHLRTAGVDLAFCQGEPATSAGSHHGFLVESTDAVDAVRARLQEGEVALTDDCTETALRSIKFRDLDGYECEVYWEPSWSS